MNNKSFGELRLVSKTNLNGMLLCEWVNFKKYAEIHFKYLKIKHLIHHWNGWLEETTLHFSNGKYVEFQNFFTKNNLIKFVEDNGYSEFINNHDSLCEDKINNNTVNDTENDNDICITIEI